MIQVCKPTIDEETKKELLATLDSGWFGNGPKVKEFETKFAEYVGAKYAVAVNSCTAALDLCLTVAGIEGGEMITSPMTFVSTAIVGEWHNMDVTFADINPDTLCIDPESVKITPQTKAIIAVDSHGRLADIKALRAKFGGLIVEDAAHACFTPGAGQDADLTCWSFQAVKTMPIGDGGMITTNNEEFYNKLKDEGLTWLGVVKSTWERVSDKKYTWDYDIKNLGKKYYMIDILATIGLGQLRRLEETNQRRRDIQAKYNEAFKDVSQIKLPVYSYTVQYYTMQCENRDGLGEFLADNGIATSVHFKPLSEMSYYKKCVKNPLPGCEVWKKLLSLPVHNALTDSDLDLIIYKVKEFYAKS